jgi:hypothetical protein
MFLKYLDLPKVPNELLSEIDKIITSSNDELDKFTGFAYTPLKLYPITGPLLDWIKQNVPIEFGSCIHVHVITDTLVIHKDFQTNKYKINYIFDTGGDNVLTHFYDDQQTLLESHKIKSGCWHQFDGQVYHNVTGVNKPRIAITLGTDTSFF